MRYGGTLVLYILIIFEHQVMTLPQVQRQMILEARIAGDLPFLAKYLTFFLALQ